MSRVVLDSSAVLALLNGERGSDAVRENLAQATISAVNIAEVVTRLARAGEQRGAIQEVLNLLDLTVADFDDGLAKDTGMLVVKTAKAGLSLGDRACLALAAREDLPALTADRAWSNLEIGVEVRFVR